MMVAQKLADQMGMTLEVHKVEWDMLRRFLAEIGLLTTLSEQGITAEDIPWMTENCFKVSAASIANHPMQADRQMVSRLYEKAM